MARGDIPPSHEIDIRRGNSKHWASKEALKKDVPKKKKVSLFLPDETAEEEPMKKVSLFRPDKPIEEKPKKKVSVMLPDESVEDKPKTVEDKPQKKVSVLVPEEPAKAKPKKRVSLLLSDEPAKDVPKKRLSLQFPGETTAKSTERSSHGKVTFKLDAEDKAVPPKKQSRKQTSKKTAVAKLLCSYFTSKSALKGKKKNSKPKKLKGVAEKKNAKLRPNKVLPTVTNNAGTKATVKKSKAAVRKRGEGQKESKAAFTLSNGSSLPKTVFDYWFFRLGVGKCWYTCGLSFASSNYTFVDDKDRI